MLDAKRSDTVGSEESEYTRWKDDHDEAPVRPYRWWNAEEKCDMPHRFYSVLQNALNGAFLETAWWMKPGHSIEVYDVRTAKHLATFTRQPGGGVTRWLDKSVTPTRGNS